FPLRGSGWGNGIFGARASRPHSGADGTPALQRFRPPASRQPGMRFAPSDIAANSPRRLVPPGARAPERLRQLRVPALPGAFQLAEQLRLLGRLVVRLADVVRQVVELRRLRIELHQLPVALADRKLLPEAPVQRLVRRPGL